MAKSKTPNQNEIEKVMKKMDEHDAAGTITSTKDLNNLMDPPEVKGDVWREPKKKAKKGK
jgi:hypothetical protein